MPHNDATRDAILIVTTGRSDVQIVRDGLRHEVDRKHCAALHSQIEMQSFEVATTSLPKSGATVMALGDGKAYLYTPKLNAVLKKCVAIGLHITDALVLDTNRDRTSYPGDPHHAGPIFTMRLLQHDPLIRVHRVTYLSGLEPIETRNAEDEAIVTNAIVTTIQAAVDHLIASAPAASAIVASVMSGPPSVSSLTETIIQLYARDRDVYSLSVADGSATAITDMTTIPSEYLDDVAIVKQTRTSPQESFLARSLALDLIRNGNLIGAWGAVRHIFYRDQSQKYWTRVVRWLHQWSSSLPLDKECDIPVIVKSMASPLLRAALRVECSLRSQDYPAGILGTVAFYEEARRAFLIANGFREHPRWWQRHFVNMGQHAHLVRSSDNPNGPIELEWDDNGLACANPSGNRLRDLACTLMFPAMAKLFQAVNFEVQSLRNEVAHGVPSEVVLRHARNVMQDRELWSSKDTFLSQDLIIGVLSELDIESIGFTLPNLVADVEERLLTGSPNRSAEISAVRNRTE